MYYPASDTIAAKWPQWGDAIEKIDQLLYDNAGKTVRVDFVASFVDETSRTVEQILKEYATLRVVERLETFCCPNHPGILLDPTSMHNTLQCDLCDQKIELEALSRVQSLRIAMPQTIDASALPHVFISHSSKDREFVRKLVADLKLANLPVWFDEQQIGVGDSIVSKINEGLSKSLYVVAVLSKSSVSSVWVQNELNYATLRAATDKSIVILPALIDDCDIPPLLLDRLYADFRRDYQTGLRALLDVLEQVKLTLISALADAGKYKPASSSSCVARLAAFKLSDVQLGLEVLDRSQIAAIWFGFLETDMDQDYPRLERSELVIKMLQKAKQTNSLEQLYELICKRHPHFPNP